MTKITTMTAEQSAEIDNWRETHLKLGRRTTPANWDVVQELISSLYEAIGETPPLIMQAQSPWQAMMMVGFYDSQLSSQLDSQLRSQLSSQLSSQLYSQLSSQLDSQLSKNAYEKYNLRWAPSWWRAWQVFYAAARDVLGVKYNGTDSNRLDLWMKAINDIHWMVPFKGICFVSDFPVSLSIDSAGRLHNESKAALEYADGYAIFAWHGSRIEWDSAEHVILHPDRLTVTEIDKETNQEVKRVMLQRYGLDRYLRDGKAKCLHRDQYGKLYQKELPGTSGEDGQPLKLTMVAVKNSTPEPDGSIKDYFLQVPPHCKTAREAVAWTFGFEAHEYAPVFES